MTTPSTPPLPGAQTTTLAAAGPRSTWAAQMARRFCYQLVLKTVGISGFMWIFFTLYFHLLRNPVRPVTVMPLTALDHAILFEPGAIAAYVSLWIYVGIPAGMMLSLRKVVLYGLWAGALCLAGLAVFYLVPTAVPPYDFAADPGGHSAFRLLRGVDAAGNACPSLHVATATFTALWVRRLLNDTGARRLFHGLNWCWLALIVHSTLAIKQHVVLDALAGAALALPFAWAALRAMPDAFAPEGRR